MKIVAFNGSPRRNGNTAILINSMFEIFQSEGIETEFIQLGNKPGSRMHCLRKMQGNSGREMPH